MTKAVEHLPCKCEDLSSNSSTTQKLNSHLEKRTYYSRIDLVYNSWMQISRIILLTVQRFIAAASSLGYHFLSLWQSTGDSPLGGKIYFSSWFHRFQSMVTWSLASGPVMRQSIIVRGTWWSKEAYPVMDRRQEHRGAGVRFTLLGHATLSTH
jgi:hypothetical protein